MRRTGLATLLDFVEQGEEITITRHGRPVARLVRPAAASTRNEARAALRRIRERAERMRSGPFDWDEWKTLRRRRPAVRVVLDSSATLAWIFGDETTEAITALYERIADEGALVPTLWRLEVATP